MMRVATVCPPSSTLFLPAVERLFRDAGHEVRRFGDSAVNCAAATAWGPVVWCEWAGAHAAQLVRMIGTTQRLIVRLHRFEVDNVETFASIRWEEVAALVVTSEHVAARARAIVPDLDSRSRVVVIPSIVDFDAFPLVERTEWTESAALRVAVVGNISGRKQPGLALAALDELHQAWNVRMTFVGTAVDPWWERYIRGHAMSRLVEIRPWTDDVVGIWREHDVCLVASADEGCPYNPIEAMACGAAPLVHRYEGADAQFPEEALWRVPRDVHMAARRVTNDRGGPFIRWTPAKLRAWAFARYSIEANRGAVLALLGGAS